VSVLCKHLKGTLKIIAYSANEQLGAVMTCCSICTEDLSIKIIFNQVVVVVVVVIIGITD
jgi:hypothetical protein